MPHGTPDFWGYAPKQTTYALQDMAELAARLGSIHNFDRRGDTVWFDDCQNGLSKLSVTGSGTGNEVYPNVSEGRFGAGCLVLKTGSTAGDMSGVQRVLPYPALGAIGAEIGFVPVTYMRRMLLILAFFTGSYLIQFWGIYDHVNGRVKVLHSDGAEYNVGTPGIQRVGYGNYCVLKLVGDILNMNYVRLIFNASTYLVDTYEPRVTADSTTKSMMVGVYGYTDQNYAIEIPLGYVLITQNEPI